MTIARRVSILMYTNASLALINLAFFIFASGHWWSFAAFIISSLVAFGLAWVALGQRQLALLQDLDQDYNDNQSPK